MSEITKRIENMHEGQILFISDHRSVRQPYILWNRKNDQEPT